MDDAGRQRDEAIVLASMYGDDFFDMSGGEWVLRYNGAAFQADLTIRLPDDYPSRSPPELELDAPGHAAPREVCHGFLADFVPDEEFGQALAQLFYDFCGDAGGLGAATASPGPCAGGGGGDLIEETADGTSATAAVIEVEQGVAAEISTALLGAGFQDCGTGVFVQGERGVLVVIREALHVSVDGVDAETDLANWVAGRLAEDIATFGDGLLRWADSYRAADEDSEFAEDGVFEPSRAPQGGGTSTLTGNAAWRARLQAGETVAFRGKGNSLHPRIKSGECCQYAPVFKHEDIKEKDVVFCQIKGRYWGHMVKKKTFVGGRDVYEYTISNIHGWENGTCTLPNIYGKVIAHWK